MARILVIDNYDSFVYNLVQYLGQLKAEPVVFRNDAIDIDRIQQENFSGIVLSPGPGMPKDSGICPQVVKTLGAKTPILGVCLGHQVIGEVFGAKVIRSTPMHGKTSEILHEGTGVFHNLPNPLTVTRYHSLVVSDEIFPDDLQVTARSEDGTIMAMTHKKFAITGVQFHPESILTQNGLGLISNWLGSLS